MTYFSYLGLISFTFSINWNLTIGLSATKPLDSNHCIISFFFSRNCRNQIFFYRMVWSIVLQSGQNSTKPFVKRVSIHFVVVVSWILFLLEIQQTTLDKTICWTVWTTINLLPFPDGFFGLVNSPFKNASLYDFTKVSI